MKVKIIILLILIVLFTIFVTQNTHIITISFLFWGLEMSAIVLISLMMLIGVIAGFIIAKMFDNSRKPQASDSEHNQISK